MRLARYLAGAVAVLLAIWVIIGEQITGASSNAVINARLIEASSPIPGFVSDFNPQLGALFEPNEKTSTITNPYVDTKILADLEYRLSILESDVEALSGVVTISNTAINQIEHQLDGYTDIALSKNQNAILRLEERIRLFEEVESERVKINEARLSVKSIQNIIELSLATENIALLRIAQSDILNGLFLGEEFNDLHQLRRDLLERNTIRAEKLIELQSLERQILILKNQIIKETEKIFLFSQYVFYANARSRLWTRAISNGEYVLEGIPLFELALCDNSIITLSVSQGVFNKLSIGQNAQFISDSNQKKYQAKIIRLAGSGASRTYRNLAVPPNTQETNRFNVILESVELAKVVSESCTVGTTGRVFFERRPLDWLRSLIS